MKLIYLFSLKAAITHWGALGNTSIDTFRQAFLKREGKLEKDENKQTIHILPTAFDVLLDKLTYI